jgi:thioredoxin 1
MGSSSSTEEGIYLGWVTGLVQTHASKLLDVVAAANLGPEESFACAEEALHAYLALPHARALLAQPEDVEPVLLALATGLFKRHRARSTLPLLSAPGAPGEGDRPPADGPACEPMEALIARAEAQAVLLGSMNLLAQVQRQVASLRLIGELKREPARLGLTQAAVAFLFRRAAGHLALCLTEGDLLVASAERPRRALSELPDRAPVAPPASMLLLEPPDEASFEAEVLRSSEPVIVHFVADWCKPCHAMTPLLEELSVELAGSVRVVLLDAERCPTLTARLQIRALPTLLFFRGGELRSSHVGAVSRQRLDAWVGAAMAGALESTEAGNL